MIPLRLTLQNFLSYGNTPQTIDFAPYHLICLSGKNGHGKSALLDAITWATWGQARKTSGTTKPDVGLIRLGQSRAMVIYDFMCAGQTYKIKRECTIHYGKNYTTLEFAVYNPETEQYNTLTEKTIRQTQKKIELALRLDYQSFCNSSFLRQGNANEFSTKAPRERKQILSSILGIDHYELLRKTAQLRHRTFASELHATQAVQTQLQKKQLCQETLNQAIDQVEAHIANSITHGKALQRRSTILHAHVTRLQKQAAHVSSNYALEEKRKKQHEQLINQLQRLKHEWKQAQSGIHHAPQRAQLEQARLSLEKEIEQKQHEQKLYNHLEAERNTLIQQLLAAQQQQKKEHVQQLEMLQTTYVRTSTELALTQSTLRTLDTQHAQLDKNVHAHSYELEQLITAIQNTEKQLAQLNSDYSHCEHMIQRLQKLDKKRALLQQRLDEIHTHTTHITHADGGHCPVCMQSIPQDQRNRVVNTLNRQRQHLQHQITRLSALQKYYTTYTKQRASLSKAIDAQTQALAQLNTKHTLVQDIHTNDIQQVQQLTAKRIECTQRMNILEETAQAQQQQYQAAQRLNDNTAIKQLTNKKAALEQRIQTIAASTAELPILTQRLYKLQQSMHEQSTNTIRALQQERRTTIRHVIAQLRSLDYHPSQSVQLVQRSHFLKEALEKSTRELKQSLTAQETLQAEFNTYTAQRERLQAQQETLNETKQELATLEKRICTLSSTVTDYASISTALSKDGIQALLIEQALPEIEQEANTILAALTDNQTHISIASLRDLKKGGNKETLEINISDEQGVRPYELFSGGEAFRIDFALRIAVSKLLATRAGTSLETLIIDEGFGSQDPQSLALIMETLYKIQNTFAKIIIVSHLTELQNQFPVHFVVHKTAEGSTVTVRENG